MTRTDSRSEVVLEAKPKMQSESGSIPHRYLKRLWSYRRITTELTKKKKPFK